METSWKPKDLIETTHTVQGSINRVQAFQEFNANSQQHFKITKWCLTVTHSRGTVPETADLSEATFSWQVSGKVLWKATTKLPTQQKPLALRQTPGEQLCWKIYALKDCMARITTACLLHLELLSSLQSAFHSHRTNLVKYFTISLCNM